MTLQDLAGKSVAILGYGKEGSAVLQAIRSAGIDCRVTVLDAKPGLTVDGAEVVAGPDYLAHLDSFDVIIKSPGIPPHPAIDAVRAKITSATRLFFDTVAPAGALIVGVTGSKGKSTTTNLIYDCLKAGGKRAVLVGNIGEPAILHLKDAAADTIFVFELSSYQLMDLGVSPRLAVVTSFFPEHLDYHGSVEAYMDAKKNIARHQGPEDAVLFAADSPGAAQIAAEGHGRKIPISPDDAPVKIEDTRLIGRHNLGNIAAAYTVAMMLGVAEDDAVRAIKAFTPLPHRLQSLGVHAGIEWIDDAISTTPQSAVAALDALGDRVRTMILGGQDRGYDFTPLAERLARSQVKTAILFPGSGPRIREALVAAGTAVEMVDAATMEEAVNIARQHTSVPSVPSAPLVPSVSSSVSSDSSDSSVSSFSDSSAPSVPIVLLSTASPSYGMFKNFEEKGDTFTACVRRLS
jgi:UDP-N-acetylmuramoylalanine--D-glutamate ligase